MTSIACPSEALTSVVLVLEDRDRDSLGAAFSAPDQGKQSMKHEYGLAACDTLSAMGPSMLAVNMCCQTHLKLEGQDC